MSRTSLSTVAASGRVGRMRSVDTSNPCRFRHDLNSPGQAGGACRHDGKRQTIIGRKLARELELAFVDSDARIVETAWISIAEIFEIAGEDSSAPSKGTPSTMR